jgi:ribosome-binding protein aMBF1 (putative translation factor)
MLEQYAAIIEARRQALCLTRKRLAQKRASLK